MTCNFARACLPIECRARVAESDESGCGRTQRRRGLRVGDARISSHVPRYFVSQLKTGPRMNAASRVAMRRGAAVAGGAAAGARPLSALRARPVVAGSSSRSGSSSSTSSSTAATARLAGVRALATSAGGGPARNPNDPDPNTPLSDVLDRLADVALMTDMFRGLQITTENFFRDKVTLNYPLEKGFVLLFARALALVSTLRFRTPGRGLLLELTAP